MTRVSLMGMTAGISTEKDFIIYFTTSDDIIPVLIQLGNKYVKYIRQAGAELSQATDQLELATDYLEVATDQLVIAMIVNFKLFALCS